MKLNVSSRCGSNTSLHTCSVWQVTRRVNSFPYEIRRDKLASYEFKYHRLARDDFSKVSSSTGNSSNRPISNRATRRRGVRWKRQLAVTFPFRTLRSFLRTWIHINVTPFYGHLHKQIFIFLTLQRTMIYLGLHIGHQHFGISLRHSLS